MRISDWSSDVCSSDLARRIAGGGEGVRLFDENGMATPYLDEIAERLGDLDEGYRTSRGFYDALLAYELLEPFSLEVTLDDGSTNSLVGFHIRSEEHTSELQSLMRISYAVLCLKKKTHETQNNTN